MMLENGVQYLQMSPLRKCKLYQVQLAMAKNPQHQLCQQEEQLLKEWRDLNGHVILSGTHKRKKNRQ
jgi:hypothetical protein